MTESHARGSTVLRVWAHVLGSQRSLNIAVFGHCFCKTLLAVLAGPRENVGTRRGPRSQGGPLPISQISSPPSPPPATCSLLAPSFHRGGSNKSTGFYSCLSDILYSAGPGVSPRASRPPFFRPFLPRHTL